ncbi:hypothetical protein NOCA2280050 [metagenome]|uniref:Uncharacterized protein n=1 Tax=metagenome TaxID=256318 RepID=A0A2P2C0R1_9ZZZZ
MGICGLLALASAVTYWQVRSPASTALVAPGGSFVMCLPSPGAARGMTTSIEEVHNRSDQPVRIVKVELLRATGLRVLGISALNYPARRAFGGFGSWNGFPPRGLPPAWRAAWTRSVPADGAVIPPQAGDEYTGFIIGFAAVRGSGGPLRVTYEDGEGRRGSVLVHTTLLTSPDCHRPFPGSKGASDFR